MSAFFFLSEHRVLTNLYSARRKESLQELSAEGLAVLEIDVTKVETIQAAVDTHVLH